MIEQQIVVTCVYRKGEFHLLTENTDATVYTNARIKSYPSKSVVQVANKPIFTFIPGASRPRWYDVSPPGMAADPDRAREESQRRAAARVRDIALCNPFEYFFTWTLDGSLIDRYDPEAIYPKVHNFLNNAVKRKGFAYVLVPEYHSLKEGEEAPAIHMHGLCILGEVPIVRALNKANQPFTDKHGRPIYHMPTWTLGYSTCVPLDQNRERTANYVVKYITKSEEKIFGKWYLSSRNLIKHPEIIPLDPIRYDEFRDPEKLETHVQYEAKIYESFDDGLCIITEEFPPLQPEEP